MNAIEPLRTAYHKDSSDIAVCLLYGAALGKTYDRKEAFRLFDQAENMLNPDAMLMNMLQNFRAETYARDGNNREAAKIYYEMYKDSGGLQPLGKIVYLYGISGQSPQSEDWQIALFVHYNYAKNTIASLNKMEMPAKIKAKRLPVYSIDTLRKIYNDMFFRGVDSETAMAPDGSKSKVTVADIKAILDDSETLKQEESK